MPGLHVQALEVPHWCGGPGAGPGLGPGAGGGLGAGMAPVSVEPSSPNFMFMYLTNAFGCWDSTSFGSPEVAAHGPRLEPGAALPSG